AGVPGGGRVPDHEQGVVAAVRALAGPAGRAGLAAHPGHLAAAGAVPALADRRGRLLLRHLAAPAERLLVGRGGRRRGAGPGLRRLLGALPGAGVHPARALRLRGRGLPAKRQNGRRPAVALASVWLNALLPWKDHGRDSPEEERRCVVTKLWSSSTPPSTSARLRRRWSSSSRWSATTAAPWRRSTSGGSAASPTTSPSTATASTPSSTSPP